MDDLPEGVGPHEGREFDLMRRGKKHVAMFEYVPDGLQEFLDEGGFSSFVDLRDFSGKSYPVLFVHRDGHEEDARRLCLMTRDPPKGFQPDHERAVGHILGYTDAQIDAFLAHVHPKSRRDDAL